MIAALIVDELRLLTFRRPSAAIERQWKSFLGFGLCSTWIVGMGRYWDNPRADVWQRLGLGSVIYVFVLALLIWGLLVPLRPKRWSYRNVLLFITLTSPPALLYAIPVEQFLSPEAARLTNAGFLAFVALWRVALLGVFLLTVARLSAPSVVVATLLPLAIIVVTLSMLNLEHVVFQIMSGIRPEDQGPHDDAYHVVFVLSLFSVVALPFLLVAYLVCVYRAWGPFPAATMKGAAATSVSPGRKADGSLCLHTGEVSAFCTQCWMNLYQERMKNDREENSEQVAAADRAEAAIPPGRRGA